MDGSAFGPRAAVVVGGIIAAGTHAAEAIGAAPVDAGAGLGMGAIMAVGGLLYQFIRVAERTVGVVEKVREDLSSGRLVIKVAHLTEGEDDPMRQVEALLRELTEERPRE